MLIKSSAKDTDLIIEHDGHLVLSIEAKEFSVTCNVERLIMNSAEVNEQINSFITKLINA